MENLEDIRKMNILVLGASGAGKSTLIKAISGAEVMTGVGEGNTQKIDVYESTTWPLRFIDTKGFEYNIIEQWKTIHQVKKYTKEQITTNEKQERELGIDAVWYCIEGTARRTFSHNIELMNQAVKGWKNVPVFAVITKSYSEIDIPENIQAVQQAFAKSKRTNLKKIIPVVAQEYPINDEMIVVPKGVDELCLQTLECVDEAKKINESNRSRMVLEQKRYNANFVTAGAAASAIAVGAIPFNFADSLILVPIETGLTKAIFKIYGVHFSQELLSAIVGSSLITLAAKQVVSLVKTVPIAGDIINGTVAGVFVFALGESIIAVSEAIITGKMDASKIDSVVEFIAKKIKDNAILDAAINYIQSNLENLNGKTSKEIFDGIQNSIKNAVIKKSNK